jgi:antitoxin component of MazEF toxin-antitoxin module
MTVVKLDGGEITGARVIHGESCAAGLDDKYPIAPPTGILGVEFEQFLRWDDAGTRDHSPADVGDRRVIAADERQRADIRVYTRHVRIVKVRRVGNSNVVSIPREFEASGYTPGSSVLMEELPGGELRILPTAKLREQIAHVGQRIVADHPEALRMLAEHDPDVSVTGP